MEVRRCEEWWTAPQIGDDVQITTQTPHHQARRAQAKPANAGAKQYFHANTNQRIYDHAEEAK